MASARCLASAQGGSSLRIFALDPWALEDIHLKTSQPPDLQMEMSERVLDFSLLWVQLRPPKIPVRVLAPWYHRT